MTVNDLIKQLQAIPEENRELMMVAWAPGEEVNTYLPMTTDDVCWYVSGSAWSGQLTGLDGPVPDSVLVWDR